jgi:uncharacterized membrane protein YbhN (UPF0104 family)
MHARNAILGAVSIVITLFLIAAVGFDKIVILLVQIPLEIWVVVFALSCFAILLDAFALWILLTVYNPAPFFSFLPHYLLSWTIGSILPGRIGDFSLAFFQDSIKVERKKIAVAVFLTKLITLIAVVGVGWVLVLTQSLPSEWNTFLLGVSGIVTLVILAILVGKKWSPIITHILKKVSPKLGNGYHAWVESDFIATKNFFLIGNNFIITLIRLVITGISFKVVLTQLGSPIGEWHTTASIALASLSVFVPFTFNGVGIRESLIVSLLVLLGVSATAAATAALVHLVAGYGIVLILAIGLWSSIRGLRKK